MKWQICKWHLHKRDCSLKVWGTQSEGWGESASGGAGGTWQLYQGRCWHCHCWQLLWGGSIFGNETGSLPWSVKHCYCECCICARLNVLASHGERHAGPTEHNHPWQSKAWIKTLASVFRRAPDSPWALCVVHAERWIPSKSDLKPAYVAKWGAAQT